MPLSGGTMTGPLNANNQIISNLAPNISQKMLNPLTLGDASQFFYGEFYNVIGQQANINALWTPNTPISLSWSSEEHITSSNYQNFFYIGNANNYDTSALYILSPGLYTFTFSILTNNYNISNPASIKIILLYSSTEKIINTGIVKPLSSFSCTSLVYIDPSFSNPFITCLLYTSPSPRD